VGEGSVADGEGAGDGLDVADGLGVNEGLGVGAGLGIGEGVDAAEGPVASDGLRTWATISTRVGTDRAIEPLKIKRVRARASNRRTPMASLARGDGRRRGRTGLMIGVERSEEADGFL
jgi:hypothetical protein